MNISKKVAAVAFVLLCGAAPAFAGKGGSNAKIVAAVQSGSVDAITAEVERAEGLMCPECVGTVLNLLEDNRFAVREVAAWWFAKRPGAKDQLATQFKAELSTSGSIAVRNAADFLGRVRQFDALPQLRVAIKRTDISAEAKLAIVRAVGYMAHPDGNSVLLTAMNDGDASVRAAAVTAWREILGQLDVKPLVSKLADSDASVRAAAAMVVGVYGEPSARTQLEQLVTTDTDSFVRRNAAWALGRIGDNASAQALQTATNDKSGIVRGYASAALAELK
ncbi:MAG TPA: HEAT repeat domain-containing protein [Kofleriaceae bacterium]|nr:HEAT repeat domain-containing protein [Kofleriaceae bacterium]